MLGMLGETFLGKRLFKATHAYRKKYGRKSQIVYQCKENIRVEDYLVYFDVIYHGS